MILILGKGVLATALHSKIVNSKMVGRPDFDFAVQHDCDRLISLYDPTVVINTVAVNQQKDPWTILTTNFTSAVYLTLKFYDKMSQGQIINIGSASSVWPSYPGIDTQRLCYNCTKENLATFGRHFNRKIVDDKKPVTVSTVELKRFASPMNNFHEGMNIDRAVDAVLLIMQNQAQQITFTK